MRISDWSSDVYSSDLLAPGSLKGRFLIDVMVSKVTSATLRLRNHETPSASLIIVRVDSRVFTITTANPSTCTEEPWGAPHGYLDPLVRRPSSAFVGRPSGFRRTHRGRDTPRPNRSERPSACLDRKSK